MVNARSGGLSPDRRFALGTEFGVAGSGVPR